MATQGIKGCAGSVSGTPAPGDVGSEVKSWVLNLETELLDGTSFDSNCFQEWIAGLQSGSGNLVGIGTPPIEGAITALTLQVGQTAGDLKITANAILNNININVQVKGEPVTYTSDFSLTADITVGVVV